MTFLKSSSSTPVCDLPSKRVLVRATAMIDDPELLQRYADGGDETAFTTLVARKINFVYSAALRQVGDAHLAEEVTQSVFLDLARKAGALARHTSITGWLYTSTRFAAYKAARVQQRWQQRTRKAQAMHEIEHEAPFEPAWAQLRPVLDAALAELNDRDREALLLRFFEDLPLAHVGSKIGLSENSARMRVDRALEKLRRTLARRGVTSTSVALALVLSQHAVTAAPAGLAATVAGSALAGAAAAGAATATTLGTKLFHLMATSKIQAGTAGMIGLAALAAVFVEHRENTELRAENAQVQTQVAALRQENERLAGQNFLPAPSSPSSSGVAIEPESDANGKNPVVATLSEAHTLPFPVDDADIARLMDLQQKGQIEARYGALFQRLNLSPEKLEQLKKLLLDRQNAARDALTAAKPQGLSPEELQANLPLMIEQTNREIDANLQGLLGENAYEQYRQYQATLPQRILAEQLAGRVQSTDPLSSQQLEQLVQILAANSPAANNPPPSGHEADRVMVSGSAFATNEAGPVFTFGGDTAFSNTNAPLSEAALAQASSILTPAQTKALQQIQAEQQAARAMSERLMSSFPHSLPATTKIP